MAIADGLSSLSSFSDLLDRVSFSLLVEKGVGPFGMDTSIEGMKSQEFSVGIFYFLIICIVVFTIFVFMFMFKSKKSNLKTGEKILFAWILGGIVVAVLFAAAQMLHGYLF
jgi:heme/copper-type cytochrome/quinol oxidase subunit 4